MKLSETIYGRKSVRSYDGNLISEQHRNNIEAFCKEITNPFDIPVEFVLLRSLIRVLRSPMMRNTSQA